MDSPTLNDRLTGTIRNIQQSALDLVQLAAEVAARSGANEQQVHFTIQRCFQQVQQQTTQTQWQPQPTLTGTYSGPQGSYTS